MRKFADIAVLAAGILWGLAGIFVSRLNALGFTSIQISALRWILSAILMPAVVFFIDKDKLKIKICDLGWFFCTGILCILLSSTLYFVTIPLTTAAVANILMYTSPIWIMIFSLIFFKENLTESKLTALFLAFFGCAFATGVISKSSLSFAPLGIVTGMLSGLFYGLYSIFGKFVLKKYDSITVTLYTVIFAGGGALFMINIPQTASLIVLERAYLLIILLAVLVTILPYTFYTVGLKNSSSMRAGILCCIEPVTSSLAGTFLLNQPFTLFQLLGIIMILLSGIILGFKKTSDL